jgi:hypothetical protein
MFGDHIQDKVTLPSAVTRMQFVTERWQYLDVRKVAKTVPADVILTSWRIGFLGNPLCFIQRALECNLGCSQLPVNRLSYKILCTKTHHDHFVVGMHDSPFDF